MSEPCPICGETLRPGGVCPAVSAHGNVLSPEEFARRLAEVQAARADGTPIGSKAKGTQPRFKVQSGPVPVELEPIKTFSGRRQSTVDRL